MWSDKAKGFTLLEVLVSVAVLGLVASGAIKLSIVATRTLDSIVEETRLLDRVQTLETEILSGECPDNGEKDGLKWDSRAYSFSLMDGLWEVRYRQLEVDLGDRSMTLYIP
ncbi:type II secretion system protein [Dethiosulfovibrio faecalis]|uniref:type II secretion system protein n=1 Tax=Dethiosulfovibrio faecalis TaxID=2720018 RepID=UPI003B834A51